MSETKTTAELLLDIPENAKILLAEDDTDDQELFADAIGEAGIKAEITTVENGQELVDHLKNPAIPNPDIVFVDLNMPVKNGKEALAEIKADNELKDIPTVVLSTSGNEKNIRDTYESGADMYVQKPTSFRNFVSLLRTVFSFYWAGKLLRSARSYFFLSEKHLPTNNGGK